MENNIGKRKLIVDLVLNILIVGLEVVGLVLSVRRHGIKVFQFYTENSNYFALIVSVIFCIVGIIALIRNRKVSYWIFVLRYIATVCLTLTLIIVLFVLIPMYPDTVNFILFYDSNLYQHLICPILSIFSFLFFEKEYVLSKKSIVLGVIPTVVYGVICVILNVFNIIIGPYPFFFVHLIPWYYLILWYIGLLLLCVILIAIILYTFHSRRRKKLKRGVSNVQKAV